MRTNYYFVYILATRRNGVLYTGMTNDIERRGWQHRDGFFGGFTKKYGVKLLVWFETHRDVHEAIRREKAVKHWRRAWKITLIEEQNPEWRDIWDDFAKPDND